MKRIFSILALLLAPLALSPLAARAQAPDADSLVGAMMSAERTAQFSATETLPGKGEKFRVWRDGRRRRIEWLAPSIRRGDVLVDDGTNVWLYFRQDNSAIQTKSTPQRAGKMGKVFAARVAGSETVAGRKAWIVEVTSRKNNAVVRRFAIDAATKITLRRENLKAGKTSEKWALQNVSFGKIPASRFGFSPPSGASVTRTSGTLFVDLQPAQRGASWLGVPNFVPAGYAFESAVVDGSKGEAWLRFSSGARRFSIFQQRVASSETKEPQDVDGGLYWQRGGYRFLAVGLPKEIASRVAQSMN